MLLFGFLKTMRNFLKQILTELKKYVCFNSNCLFNNQRQDYWCFKGHNRRHSWKRTQFWSTSLLISSCPAHEIGILISSHGRHFVGPLMGVVQKDLLYDEIHFPLFNEKLKHLHQNISLENL